MTNEIKYSVGTFVFAKRNNGQYKFVEIIKHLENGRVKVKHLDGYDEYNHDELRIGL